MNRKTVTFDFEKSQPEGDYGLRKIIDKAGCGIKALNGFRVILYYRGFLIDGREFDRCQSPGEPYSVKPGSGRSIKGLEMACNGIQKGEICRIYIPAYLAYGDKGSLHGIPPGSDLIFELQVLDCIPPLSLDTSFSFNPMAACGDIEGMKCYVIKNNIFFPDDAMGEILEFIKSNRELKMRTLFEHFDFEFNAANIEHVSSLIEKLVDEDYLILS